jgi:hypothetical protein
MKARLRLEQDWMVALRVFLFGAAFGILLLLAGPSHAACVDDERFKQAVKEAREKARAFRAQKERRAAAEEERLQATDTFKERKARQEEELERIRKQYVEQRDRKPTFEKEREQMERDWERRRAEKNKALELAGVEYGEFQRCLQKALKDGESLDPAEELDARSRRNPFGENLKPGGAKAEPPSIGD